MGDCKLLRDYFFFLRQLRSAPHVIHLTSVAQLGLFRDLIFLWTARKFRIPVIYHLRFGRIPQIITDNTKEWRFLKRAMQSSHLVMVLDRASKEAIREALPAVKVDLLANCFDPKELLSAVSNFPEQRNVLLLAWLFTPQKG